jgi:hypothetical protein
MKWVATILHTTSEHGVTSITTADVHTSTELTPPDYLIRLVRFAERRNLVSARVPSHFKRSLPNGIQGRCVSIFKVGATQNYCLNSAKNSLYIMWRPIQISACVFNEHDFPLSHVENKIKW